MRFVDTLKMKIEMRDRKWLLAVGIFALIAVKFTLRLLGGAGSFSAGLISVFLIPIKILMVLIAGIAGIVFMIFCIGFIGSLIAGRRTGR